MKITRDMILNASDDHVLNAITRRAIPTLVGYNHMQASSCYSNAVSAWGSGSGSGGSAGQLYTSGAGGGGTRGLVDNSHHPAYSQPLAPQVVYVDRVIEQKQPNLVVQIPPIEIPKLVITSTRGERFIKWGGFILGLLGFLVTAIHYLGS